MNSKKKKKSLRTKRTAAYAINGIKNRVMYSLTKTTKPMYAFYTSSNVYRSEEFKAYTDHDVIALGTFSLLVSML